MVSEEDTQNEAFINKWMENNKKNKADKKESKAEAIKEEVTAEAPKGDGAEAAKGAAETKASEEAGTITGAAEDAKAFVDINLTAEQLRELEDKLKEAETKRDEYLDMAQRVQAEFINYKRRNANSEEKAREDGRIEAVRAMLPALDSLEKALLLPDMPADVKTGLDLIEKLFKDSLSKLGIEHIEAEGTAFDPNLHDAVMREEKEGCEANQVTEVFQQGYKCGDRIIRHSIVKVSM